MSITAMADAVHDGHENQASYRKYEVAYNTCRLVRGDLVTPRAVIGRHYRTGETVRAALYGHIASIYYNPMHESLMIMAVAVKWYDIALFCDPFGPRSV